MKCLLAQLPTKKAATSFHRFQLVTMSMLLGIRMPVVHPTMVATTTVYPGGYRHRRRHVPFLVSALARRVPGGIRLEEGFYPWTLARLLKLRH